MLKILLAGILAAGFLTVAALMGSNETDDFMKALEDEEQAEYLKEWREKHGRR